MSRRTLAFLIGGLAVALVLAFGVSRFASSSPDGLERVATDNGIAAGAQDHRFADGPFAGYSTKGIGDRGFGTGLAGVVGVAATFIAAGGIVAIASAARRRRPSASAATPPAAPPST